MSYFKHDYIPTCQDCEHANLYIPVWSYPFTDPKCEITGRDISPGDIACKDFRLIGRLGR